MELEGESYVDTFVGRELGRVCAPLDEVTPRAHATGRPAVVTPGPGGSLPTGSPPGGPTTTTEISSPRTHPAVIAGCLGLLAFAVVAFTGAWTKGQVTLDGAGVALYARLGVDHIREGGLPYWLPEMWAGSPAWALAPSFPVYFLLPFTTLFGPEVGVKVVTLLTQVVGAWGTFVLARSLWSQRRESLPVDPLIPAVLAGLFYGLHPLFISHGALFGHETSVWVMAATPWLVWSFRLALIGAGARYIALAGLVAAFAVLQQAEHAYSLVVLCACMLAVEAARARVEGAGSGSVTAVLLRGGTAAVIGLALVAHWLAPFLSLADSFVFTPAESVRAVLVDGIGGALGRHPDAWLSRPEPLSGTVSFEQITRAFDRLDGVGSGGFYLSLLLVGLTLVTLILLARHDDDDGHLTAILFASAIGIWLSSGGVALASSDLAERGILLPFAILGVTVGALVGGFLRRLRLGRVAIAAGVIAAMFFVILPYITPFLALQKVVPFLSSIRFPRFYPVAMLGLALGAVYPLTMVAAWAYRRRAEYAPLLTGALALALAGAFLVDIDAYRSYYRLRPPDSVAASADAARRLAAEGDDFRVAAYSFGDPRLIESLLAADQELSVGWPHPLAGKDLWSLTGSAVASLSRGYRDSALALSSTAFLASEKVTEKAGRARVSEIVLERNPRWLPMVRAYDQAVVVEEPSLAAGLAVALAQRHIGVVTGDGEVAKALGPPAAATVGPDGCGPTPQIRGRAAQQGVAGEVAMACALDRWVDTEEGRGLVDVSDEPGAVFRASASGLRGVSVLLDGEPGRSELVLRKVGSDGRSIGDEVLRTRASGRDHNELTAFAFDAIASSAGTTYAFQLACAGCAKDERPRLGRVAEASGNGNFVAEGRLDRRRLATFSLLYDRVPAAEPSATTVTGTRVGPGAWRVTTSGTEPSLVVVGEAWFPGWDATVDGRNTQVHKADGAFLGVPVAAGSHTVELRYRAPFSATVGRVLTLGGLVVCAVFLLVPRRRRKRRNHKVGKGRGHPVMEFEGEMDPVGQPLDLVTDQSRQVDERYS